MENKVENQSTNALTSVQKEEAVKRIAELKAEVARLESVVKAMDAKYQTREEADQRVQEVKEDSIDDINKAQDSEADKKNCLTRIIGYRFSLEMVKMAILMYVYGGCSLRSVVKNMEVVKFVVPFLDIKIPSFVTIRDWVLKAGLDTYRKRGKNMSIGEVYALVTDESITVHDSKLLVSLAVPDQHPGKPLAHEDTEIMDIHIAHAHNSEDVRESVKRTTEVLGHSPEYSVTDNGSPMIKGMREAGIPNHRDISHTFATYLKALYDNDEQYKSLVKSIGGARHYTLTDCEYLMPCNMRSHSRYMNVFNWIHWAKGMTESSYRLTPKERGKYSFLWEHGSLIEELEEAAQCYEAVLVLCKNKGLSHETARECDHIINASLMGRGERLTRLGEMLKEYFRRELTLLKPDDVHNISSDIIESVFGYFKERKSENRLYGVTSFVMILPVHTKLSTLSSARNFDFKGSLERTHLSDIKDWKKDNLPESLVSKRAKVLLEAS